METEHGVGTHKNDVSADDYTAYRFWQYIHGPIVVTGISLVKLSVGFHLLRFVQEKMFKLSLYIMLGPLPLVMYHLYDPYQSLTDSCYALGLLVVFTLVSDLTLILQCIPVSSSWMDKTAPGVKCFSNATFARIGMFNGIINVVTDVIFVALPIPVILALRVNRRTKITLVLILSLGLLLVPSGLDISNTDMLTLSSACIASIVRVYLMSVYFADPDPLW